ncbi:MAG: Ig-like domain-containing protein [Bacilli bacterium]|jgi:uncharacterized protein YjdB
MRKFGIVLFLFLMGVFLVGCKQTTNKRVELSITETTVTVEVGEIYQIKPKLLNAAGGEVIVFTSSNVNIFTVENGFISGVAVGEAELTVSIKATDISIKIPVTVTEATDNPNPVLTSITVSPNEVEFGLNGEVILAVSGNIAVTNDLFNFSSSNQNIVSAYATGKIKAIGPGTATITVTYKQNPSIKATVEVTVISSLETLNSITATLANSELDVNATATITVVGNIAVTNNLFYFTSSNTSVATVDANGKVTAVAEGSATITVTYKENASITATVSVTVRAAVATPTITLSETSIIVEEGKTATLIATITNLENQAVTWSSNAEAKATVDANGKVTAVASGSAVITATSVANTSLKATCNVTVIENPTAPKVVVHPASITIVAGQIVTLEKLTRNLTDTSLTWNSSASNYATVDQTGKVTGVAAGSATVTATSVENTNVSASTTVTVVADTTTKGIILRPSSTTMIEVNDSGHQFYVDKAGGGIVSRLECTFTTSNSNVATVSSYGTISAKGVGFAIITATHPTHGSGMTVLNIIEPMAIPGVLNVAASPNGFMKLGTSNTYQFNITNYQSTAISNSECSFTCNPAGIINVSSSGVISALAVGYTTVTVTHPTQGSGTMIMTVEGDGGAPLATQSSWVPSQTVAVHNLGYGVHVAKYLGQTKDPGSSTMHNQEVSVMHVDNSQQAKMIVWRAKPNNWGWQLATVPVLAADYESKNPTMKVIAAINADFFDINAYGNLPYQTTGATVCEGENYKTTVGNTTAYKTIGFTNDGTTNAIIAGTPVRALSLSVYNSSGVVTNTFTVNKSNQTPGAGEVSVYFALWNSDKQIVPVNLDGGSANVYTVGNGDLVLANSADDFYGKGAISSTAKTTTLGRGQFSIVSNNETVNAALASGTTIRVQYSYTGEFANIKNATGGTRGFILNNAIVDPAECIASRSDLGQRHPRTLIGQKADGTVVMVTVGGRAEPDRYGVGVEAMQAIMAYYYCVDAYNLDGGGSTTMIVRTGTTYGSTSAFKTVNTIAGGAMRSDGNAILVVTPR